MNARLGSKAKTEIVILYNHMIKILKNQTPEIVTAVLFSTTLLVFGPASIYLTNTIEFSNSLGDLLSAGISLAVLISIVLFLVLMALRAFGPAGPEKGTALLFAAAFLLWLQGNFLLWRYGPLDGREIPWSSMKRFGYIDGAVWIVILIAAVVFSSGVHKIAGRGSLLLIFAQLAYGAVLYVGQQEPPSFKKYSVDTKNQFVFSKRNNVILLVLDSFQTDVFAEIVTESPEIAKPFEGFTYFRNSLGGYPFTELSVALMLTGRYYDNSRPFERWKKDAFGSASIPRVLKADNWQVDLFPMISFSLHYSEDIASNFVPGLPPGERRLDIAFIYDLSFFRCVPHFLKRIIHNDQDWTVKRLYLRYWKGPTRVDDSTTRLIRPVARRTLKNRRLFSPKAFQRNQDVKFVDAMLSESRVVDSRGACKFYDLGGPHIPLRLNENMRYRPMHVNRRNYKRSATASLKLMGLFLDHLQRLGIYDDSIVVIVGDHGAGYQGQSFVVQPGMPVAGDGTDIVTQPARITALPLILVKPLGSRGGLKISDQPVSLADIPATVFSDLGLPVRDSGISMFAIDGSRPRERRFLQYLGRDIYSYYGDMTEYIVDGFGWQDRAWRRSGRVFTKKRIVFLRPELYRYGSVITLDVAGNALPYLENGWGKALQEFTWTEGRKSMLTLPVTPPSSDLTLNVSFRPRPDYLGMKDRRMIVTANGTRLGEWLIDSGAERTYKMIIPRDLVRKVLRIQFDLPGLLSSSEDEDDEATNSQGVAISKIVVE